MSTIGKSARVCETCGSAIEMSSAGDLGCIACLITTGLDGEAEESCGSDSTPGQLGGYTIEHHADGSAWELGRGAMGVTYRAIDKALDRTVALKIINSDRESHSAEARARFMREARAAAVLRHPNVATVYQFGVREETGQFFYAMELIEGETLEERVRRLGPLDVPTTLEIALQVTAALEAAEERGLVHRDLKPGNLMLVSQDYALVRTDRRAVRRARRARPTNSSITVKVIDFGVAKAVAEKTNAMALTHGGFVGTPAFASPEQFTNAPVDVRSDIYSLGATLWFLLTGQMLFSGRTIEEIRDARRSKPLPIHQLTAAQVPRRFISLLTSMLAIEPAARPAGARELARKLQTIRASITGRGKIAARLALAAAIVVLATIVAIRELPSPATKTPVLIPEKSIAVLPFENLSADPDNAYFAEGMQEEILTRLASIGDLKIISRASSQRYQSKPRNLAEIAKELGVANIVEGSVQKAADQVRVNVQLINAQTDSHLWADTYDRKLTDVFGVQSEIAKGIAAALQMKLTGREEQALAVRPTKNPEAYDAYLRGLAFEARSEATTTSWSPDLASKAIDFYGQAVQLDPSFAVAWARLSRPNARLYSSGLDTTPARRAAAKRALESAQKLEPNSPDTLVALGYYECLILRDFNSAKSTFARVSKMLAGSSEVPSVLGRIARSEGKWNESIAYFEQGLALDPRNAELLNNAAQTFVYLRQFPAALKLYDRALDITPNDPDVMASKAAVYQAQGNLEGAAKLLVNVNAKTASESAFFIKIVQLTLERNLVEAIRFRQSRQAQFHFDSEYAKGVNQVWLALAQHLVGDTTGAKVNAEHGRETFARLDREQPENTVWIMMLSQAYALLGEKELALKEAERAIMLLPRAKDPLNGPSLEENLAFIQTLVGEKSRAISTFARLLQTPYRAGVYESIPITVALLRLDPIWDPLRGDPAFQKLCEKR